MKTSQSSHLQNYDYDAENQTLTVTFVNGAVYQYPGVSFADYSQLLQSGGSGTAFWAYVRNKYAAVKIAGAARSMREAKGR